jgi:hypothetical protein
LHSDEQSERFMLRGRLNYGNNLRFGSKETVSICILCSVVMFSLSQIFDSIDEGATISLMIPFIVLVGILIVMIPLSPAKEPLAFLAQAAVYVIADAGKVIAPGTPWINSWRTLFNLTYIIYYGVSTYAIYNNVGV